MAIDRSQALRPTLDRAKKTLRSALDSACAADIDDADTAELIRIEEVLAIANEAAKKVVSVRRRLSEGGDSRRDPASSHREVEDQRGVRWTVFAVHPGTATNRPTVRECFRDGWLAFDSGMETRRVAPIPDGWEAASDEALVELCERADVAPRRTRSAPAEPRHDSELPG